MLLKNGFFNIRKIFDERNGTKIFFFFSLLLIGCLFISVAFLSYQQLCSDVIHNEYENQQQMTKIVDQLLNRYFYTLKFITQNTAIQPEFNPSTLGNDNKILYKKNSPNYVNQILFDEKIQNVLTDQRHSLPINNQNAQNILAKDMENWAIFKGLPYKDLNGNVFAKTRRDRAKTLLETYSDIHYVFQMLANGDLVFLEPYNIQKNISIFNYAFRDYLNLTKATNETSISEGYISNDQHKTQIITVASPILDKNSNVVSIFAASISSETLRDKVFKTLKNNMNVNDGTIFYLIDRHGHVVASSSGKDIYFPSPDSKNDDNDQGNMRRIGFFKAIEWNKDSFEKGNLWEREIGSWNDKKLNKIYTGQYKNLDGKDVIATLYPTNLGSHRMNWGILIETPLEQVLVSGAHLRHVFYLAGLSLFFILSFLFTITLRNFRRLENKILRKEKEIIQVTTQVAHDIRSPLVALNMLLDNLTEVKEEIRITVKTAVNRINDIANNLVQQYKKAGFKALKDSPISPELIALMLDSIISEKIAEYSNNHNLTFLKEFDNNTYGIFSNVNRGEFKRAISNLINNAVQATSAGKGVIIIKLSKNFDVLNLSIIDNGNGISKSLIPKFMKGHLDTGKSGTGLGLPYAVNRFDSWGCGFDIQSEVGKGTTIEIILPQTKPADWFKATLQVKQESIVVVIDDDESIHGVWEQRFKKIFSKEDNILIKHFIDSNSFLDWHGANELNTKDIIYLVDYELQNDKLTGIDIIEKLGIAQKSVLVSSRFEDEDVRSKCVALNLKAIEKNYVRYIPIEIVCINPEIIFIDDNESITQVWKIRAKEAGKKIATFNKINDFIQLIDLYDKNLQIYIDSDLNDKLKGEVFAKELYKQGFRKIYLATGYRKDSFDKMPWITAIVDKEPPF